LFHSFFRFSSCFLFSTFLTISCIHTSSHLSSTSPFVPLFISFCLTFFLPLLQGSALFYPAPRA
jgi:hypothetical protein